MGLLFALVTFCLGGGAFQLAEKLPVWSQSFLFELRLPVWAGAFHLSETSCLDFGPPVWAGASCLGRGTFHLGWGLPSGMEPSVWAGASCLCWGLLSELGSPAFYLFDFSSFEVIVIALSVTDLVIELSLSKSPNSTSIIELSLSEVGVKLSSAHHWLWA